MADRKCEFCFNNVFDEEYGCNVCQVNLDMDEMEQYIHGTYADCPHFRFDNEYDIVKKQN